MVSIRELSEIDCRIIKILNDLAFCRDCVAYSSIDVMQELHHSW